MSRQSMKCVTNLSFRRNEKKNIEYQSNFINALFLSLVVFLVWPKTINSLQFTKKRCFPRFDVFPHANRLEKNKGSFSNENIFLFRLELFSSNESRSNSRTNFHEFFLSARMKSKLKRVSRRNRLIVLKFLLRKRRDERRRLKTRENQLNDQIDVTPTKIQIFIDENEKFRSISLFYHRQNLFDEEKTSFSSNKTENNLDLLIEAVQYIEKCRNNERIEFDGEKVWNFARFDEKFADFYFHEKFSQKNQREKRKFEDSTILTVDLIFTMEKSVVRKNFFFISIVFHQTQKNSSKKRIFSSRSVWRWNQQKSHSPTLPPMLERTSRLDVNNERRTDHPIIFSV